MKYSELSQTSQIEAFRQAMALNPIQTRTASISDLMQTYEFNQAGEVVEDSPHIEGNGDEPEYYSEMLD